MISREVMGSLLVIGCGHKEATSNLLNKETTSNLLNKEATSNLLNKEAISPPTKMWPLWSPKRYNA
jgi:hypothetical protein